MDCGIFYSQERINKLRTNTRTSGTDASSQASTSNRKEDDKMNEIKDYTEKVFEDVKHIDENGNEYWFA